MSKDGHFTVLYGWDRICNKLSRKVMSVLFDSVFLTVFDSPSGSY